MSVVSLTHLKVCTVCDCWKPATTEFFYRAAKQRFGVASECRTCACMKKRSERRGETIPSYRHRLNAASKRCNSCFEVKPIEEFGPRSSTLSGHHGTCKNCEKARRQQYYQENRDTWIERSRVRYEQNKGGVKARVKAWAEANPEKRIAYTRKYREQNREAIRALNQARYHRNLDEERRRSRLYAAKRHALKFGAGHEPYTERDIFKLWESQGGLCAYCSEPLFSAYHIDHVLPLSRGGADAIRNIVLACPPCNMSKGAKTPEEFARWLEL